MAIPDLEIDSRSSPNFEPGRGGDHPRSVVVHTTDGTFEGTCAWFESPDSGVSAHYLVGLDGRAAQFVDEGDTARHAGRVLKPTAAIARGATDLNPTTVGIEFEDGGDSLAVERPQTQYEAGGRLLAAVCARWGIPLDRDHVIGHRELFAAKDCPGNLDLERLLAEARRADSRRGGGSPRLAVLVPVRNGERDLSGFLETAELLDGAVVALDDGSSDRSAELLSRDARIARLLAEPRRESHAGWDDARNRRRLLDAAEELDPEWILFLDVDERIDADDAAALREFLAGDAVAGLAYGLQLFRAWEDLVDPSPTYVYRLFAGGSGTELSSDPLHFNPVPVAIPRRAWVRTTIRARHLDSPERLEARLRKYREADPQRRYERSSDPLLKPPERQLEPWRPRPGGLPLLAPAEPVRPPDDAPVPQGPLLVCLLPVRDGAPDLPAYLASVEAFADAVVALDDGSTDATPERLAASPLVARVIRRPRRETFEGWDDAANRQALLEAAGELDPRWVVFLDVDERIDADDAAALRRFVERDARPGEAYGFRVHRMLGDERHYDRAGLWVYRLFAWEPGQRLPTERLHLVPVPVSIPGARWQKTTIRIQHLAGLTPERRQARLRKYQQADPELRWQGEYERMILDVGEPRPWRVRPDGLPVLADPARTGAPLDLEALGLDSPLLSAIVISRNDEHTIERSVRAVVEQELDPPFEVIVVVSGSDRTAEIVRERFPQVTVVELEGDALPGAARNAGLAIARGEYVSFPGSHVELPPGSLAARLRAHERGWAMVTGSIVNGNETRAGWASYFLDHSSALPGRPSGELAGAPAHCSYVRQFLIEAGGFPGDMRAGEDTVANQALWRRGHRAWRERELRLIHRNRCTTAAKLVRHHFVRGRAFGRILREGRERQAARRALRGYVHRRLAATDLRVADWGGELREDYARVRRLVLLGILAAWLGAWVELTLTGSRPDGLNSKRDSSSRARTSARRPVPGDTRRTSPVCGRRAASCRSESGRSSSPQR